jgi:hypothetical protein
MASDWQGGSLIARVHVKFWDSNLAFRKTVESSGADRYSDKTNRDDGSKEMQVDEGRIDNILPRLRCVVLSTMLMAILQMDSLDLTCNPRNFVKLQAS